MVQKFALSMGDKIFLLGIKFEHTSPNLNTLYPHSGIHIITTSCVRNEVTKEIAAWVICRTSKHAATDPSAQQMLIRLLEKKINSFEDWRYTHPYPQQEDAKTSHHALHVMHRELLFPMSHIQGSVSLPEALIKISEK